MAWWDFFRVFKGGDSSGNLPSPRVDIDIWDVRYSPLKKRLTIDNIEGVILINTVQNTNSMEPMIDVGHIIIRSNNKKYLDNLNIGDVIVWQKGSVQKIHSIVEIGSDSKGWFAYTKGLNLNRKDVGKIRKHHIRDIALMTIWSRGSSYYVARHDD